MYLMYIRVPECLSLRRNWVPHPLTPSERVSPLEPKGGGVTHSLAGDGVGGPVRTIGQKAWHSVYSVAQPSPQTAKQNVVVFTHTISFVLRHLLPLNIEGANLYDAVKDGILLCKVKKNRSADPVARSYNFLPSLSFVGSKSFSCLFRVRTSIIIFSIKNA